MTWDMSRPASVKQRSVTPEQRTRQQQAAQNARREADAILAGIAVPVPIARPKRRAEPKEVPASEARALWAFLSTEAGSEINALVARLSSPVGQLRLLRAYRACVRGEPRAHETWARLLLELEL